MWVVIEANICTTWDAHGYRTSLHSRKCRMEALAFLCLHLYTMMWTFVKCPWLFLKKRPTSLNLVDQGICYFIKIQNCWTKFRSNLMKPPWSMVQMYHVSSYSGWVQVFVAIDGTRTVPLAGIFIHLSRTSSSRWISFGQHCCPFSTGCKGMLRLRCLFFWLCEAVWGVFCLWISRQDLWPRVSVLELIRKMPVDTRMLSLCHRVLSCQQVKTTCSLLVILTAEAT